MHFISFISKNAYIHGPFYFLKRLGSDDARIRKIAHPISEAIAFAELKLLAALLFKNLGVAFLGLVFYHLYLFGFFMVYIKRRYLGAYENISLTIVS